MDQEDTMDFKALRAKFQDEEHLLKQPRFKPALPEKPKVVPPPQSPTHYLPAGARPSLLTSINQTLEGKKGVAPRVVFKDEKKESKKPLIHTNSKGKDKNEGKLKGAKDKTAKGSKEKLNEDSLDQKQKKENGKDRKLPFVFPVAQKESTAELVPASAPPKVPKKKSLLGFKKTSKRDSVEVPAEAILDSPSTDVPGPAPLIPAPLIPAPLIPAPLIPAPLIPVPLIPAPLIPAPLTPVPLIPAPLIPAPLIPVPLIPVPCDFGDAPQEPEISAPTSLLPDNPTSPDSSPVVDISPPSTIPECPGFTPPAAIIPDIPAPEIPTPESETPTEMENPALPVSRPESQNEIIPNPPSAAPSPPPVCVASDPLPVVPASSPSPPEPELEAEADIEAVNTSAVEQPPAPDTDSPSIPSSPKAERSISALSALERAEDMSPGKRTPPCDQRIFSALEKARRKTTSGLTSPTRSYSTTPPPEEFPPSQSPTQAFPELPPIDYEDRAGNALLLKQAQANGIDHRQASPVLEGITEEGPDSVPAPELMVVPPPPPRKVLPDPESLGPAPDKPARPPSLNMSEVIPPPVEDNDIPAPLEFSETTDVPDFHDVASDDHSPELSVTEWGHEDYRDQDEPDGENLPEFYSNGTAVPGTEIHTEPAFGDEYQDNPPPESSLPISQDSPPMAEPQAENGNGAYESTDNMYEVVGSSDAKKKGKTDGGKKRKGPPKNPYAEAAQETNQEKSRMGRFGKTDKKAAAEGPDEKELKKREKQRLEKEKKELKEKQEREKKEQKEREKKENELKKKFKITGQEDAMYQAKVTVTTKGRKNDLPVKSGDIVSIIRTTNCPKGKWLARDSSNNYGYVAVEHVELDIKEMLELGKKARKTSSNVIEPEVTSTGSRASNHYPLSAESFTDDSEEWTADDEPVSPATETADPLAPIGHNRTLSMPDMGNKDLSVNHQHSSSDINPDGSHNQARHEALQKLATFFHSTAAVESPGSSTEPEMSPALEAEEEVHAPGANSTQEMHFDAPDMLILPPPDLYADLTMRDE